MESNLKPYAYLWESPQDYLLLELPTPYQGHKYSIMERPRVRRVWIEDMEVYDLITQELIKAGAQIINEQEFFELRLQECRDMWEENKDQYELVVSKFDGTYRIHHKESGASLRVEDYFLKKAIIERMLASGVTVREE